MSKVIGPAGGELQIRQATLTVPAGALPENVVISVEVRESDLDGFEALSSVYEFGPAGLAFALPAKLRLSLTAPDAEARLFRGEDLAVPPEEVPGSSVDGAGVVAPISGFSYYVAGKVRPPGLGGDFELDGAKYSPLPVTSGQIPGFSHSVADGAGVSDGEAPGHVWYGSGACVTFRTDGSGVVDLKGGSSTFLKSFPWIPMGFEPGQATAGARGLTFDSPAGSQVLDPDYDRTSELRPFRWGVRLSDSGTIYETVEGQYEYALQFTGASAGVLAWKARWDPKTNQPAGPMGSLSGYTTAPPAGNHFCSFRESRSVSADNLGPHCLETRVAAWGGQPAYTKKHCYGKGMLQGEYTIVTDDGVQLEGGRFKDNRPVSGWTFKDRTGKRLASGNYSDYGVPMGKWEIWDAGFQRETTVTFQGGLVPTERGYAIVLEGEYVDFHPDGTVRLRGSYLGGHKDLWWNRFDTLQRLEYSELFDASVQLPDGMSTCFKLSDGTNQCVPHTYSWRKQARTFYWAPCFQTPWVSDSTYDQSGTRTSQSCNEILPPYDAPQTGPATSCGKQCSA